MFLANDGIQGAIDGDMRTTESREALVGVLIQSMSNSFMTNYFLSMGILTNEIVA